MKKTFNLLIIFLTTYTFSDVPAGRETLECGDYELSGKFISKVSSTDFILEVYPETKRSFKVHVTGFYAAEFNILKNRPVKVLTRFSTKNAAKKFKGQILKMNGTTKFKTREIKPMVKLIKSLKCKTD